MNKQVITTQILVNVKEGFFVSTIYEYSLPTIFNIYQIYLLYQSRIWLICLKISIHMDHVNFPVLVFCLLGWYEDINILLLLPIW